MCNTDKIKFTKLGDSELQVQIGMEEKDFNWFSNQFTHHKPIGFLMFPTVSKVILKMKPGHKGWTPYQCARDCGDHYIVARFDRFDRIDKKTGKLTKDVEDK